MNWIEAYRRAHIGPTKKGSWLKEYFSQIEMARRVKEQGACCSADLIAILENQRGAVTHPNIANAIADLCGATPEQRDSIVAEKHRGKWERPRKRRRAEFRVKPQPLSVGVLPENAREVICISAARVPVAIYQSISEAAQATGCATSVVSKRCNRKLSICTNEFAAYDCTWRFKDEWDNMNADQKRKDMMAACGLPMSEVEEMIK